MTETLAAVISGRGDAYARLRAGDNVESLKDDLIDVTDLVRMFEESEESTYTSRKEAERDRDYYDNKQLTETQKAVLAKRGQPAVTINLIKRRVDYQVGLEKQQRIDPKALPRTPAHEQDADGASQGLRYVADSEDFDVKRSAVWRNLLLEGVGGLEVAMEEGYDGEPCIRLRRFNFDRLFWDPHSSELDFSDANYVGSVVWMDLDDALEMYFESPEAEEALETTLSTAPSETYDDKPKHSLWADKKRKRVRVCQIWVKRGKEWHFAEFTKGGILLAGPSPFITDQGESECGLILQSAFVDRDNNRYGAVREMISPQDDYNKRRSKSLHLMNSNQTTMEEGAVDDVEKFRTEAAKPDGVKVVNPGYFDKIRTETRTDLATAHFQLMQETKNEIDQMGPNATMMGDKAQGSSAASGKAIIASQQGGMMQMGDLLDGLRHFDKRVFRSIWNRIRQYWTAEKWIRVTDDERNIKWVGLNVDPQQVQMQMAENPQMKERIAGIVSNVAELDCDITIDEAPDSVTPALEQWQALVEIDTARGGVFPIDMLIEAAPNLKNKDKILERLKGGDDPQAAQQKQQQEAMQQQLQMRGAEATVAKTEGEANLKQAQAQKTMMEAQLEPQRVMDESSRAWQGQAQSHEAAQQKQAQTPFDDEGGLQQPRPQGNGDDMQQMAQAIVAALMAPKKVVRDFNNKIVGVEPVMPQQGP